MTNLSIGIDVGKRHDPSAIVVAVADNRDPPRREEVEGQDQSQSQNKGQNKGQGKGKKKETHFVVPFLQRIPLDTPYPDQAVLLADKVKDAVQQFHRVAWNDSSRIPIRVDVTGIGDALIDLLKAQNIATAGTLFACRFVGGDRINQDGTEFTIGKTGFASRLQVLSESKRVHLPKIPEAEALAQEMLDFDIDVDELSGKPTYGAIRPGTHDDMVVALGLACLKDLPNPAPICSPGGSVHPGNWGSPRPGDHPGFGTGFGNNANNWKEAARSLHE